MPNSKIINFPIVLKVLSFLLIVEGLFMLSGIGFAMYFGESIMPLLLSSLITIIVGLPTYLLTKKKRQKEYRKTRWISNCSADLGNNISFWNTSFFV